jgi:hypothetical protein
VLSETGIDCARWRTSRPIGPRNLPDLAERRGGLYAELDFEKALSVGERQRLAKPPARWIRQNEAALREQLAATPTTFVSVSHHPASQSSTRKLLN